MLLSRCSSVENSVYGWQAVAITWNKCELIKGRKQLLANKSWPLIRYSADKLNFSLALCLSQRQPSREGLNARIGICENDADVGARSHNWLWTPPPASRRYCLTCSYIRGRIYALKCYHSVRGNVSTMRKDKGMIWIVRARESTEDRNSRATRLSGYFFCFLHFLTDYDRLNIFTTSFNIICYNNVACNKF